jgi:hypothetical protein
MSNTVRSNSESGRDRAQRGQARRLLARIERWEQPEDDEPRRGRPHRASRVRTLRRQR